VLLTALFKYTRMKILLTGATGYIGKRLLPVLVEKGYTVVCCVRDPNRFNPPPSVIDKIEIVQADLLNKPSLQKIPKDIKGAYYLVHSMSSSADYQELEERSAINFREVLKETQVEHVLYLSGIVNESNLSKHLSSRKNVETELAKGKYNFTTLRAGIIIGSGSASFEIIRDLVEKLPIMVAPKWLNTKCQPIGITDVISFLSLSLFTTEVYNKNYDIGGKDVLTYKEMLLGFAKVRNLQRRIFTLPVMTPRLSSYWLYFVTSTSYRLAVNLVESMKIEVVCRNNEIDKILNIDTISYNEALEKAFKKIESNQILSSWKDANVSSGFSPIISDYIEVPSFGCFKDRRIKTVKNRELSIDKIWSIGGKTGWYYGNWLWQIRGYLDKLVGGVGLRRGRTNLNSINVGDALDFWRVLYANREEGRLLLYAEMKLPGEAWLEFNMKKDQLHQTATFRPLGVFGRLYWYAVLPFHGFIFEGMISKLAEDE
jgi:uncharacterized protein YbjT (DUF2867 family)